MTQQDRDFAILNAVRSLDAGDADVLRAYLAAESPDAASALSESETALAQMARALPRKAAPAALKQRLMAKVSAEPRRQEETIVAAPKAAVIAGRIGHGGAPALMRYAAMIIVGVVVGIVAWHAFYAAPKRNEMAGTIQQANQKLAEAAQVSTQLDQLNRLVSSGEVQLIQLGSKTKAGGRVFWDKLQNKWHVVVFDLAPPGPGKEYELWIIPKDRAPIPAKMFNVNSKGEAQLVVDVPPEAGLLLTAAITDEPAGPLQPAPTGQIHLAGSVQ